MTAPVMKILSMADTSACPGVLDALTGIGQVTALPPDRQFLGERIGEFPGGFRLRTPWPDVGRIRKSLPHAGSGLRCPAGPAGGGNNHGGLGCVVK